ncbi:MAG: hypothetical protein A2X88_04665 [Deltaproteobacteria bacterium GWC2_65_14]|nr:MAG: hypothetical protein A2X88_04665 [Deltaproteobacteria bacterium GWC2_65_14]
MTPSSRRIGRTASEKLRYPSSKVSTATRGGIFSGRPRKARSSDRERKVHPPCLRLRTCARSREGEIVIDGAPGRSEMS